MTGWKSQFRIALKKNLNFFLPPFPENFLLCYSGLIRSASLWSSLKPIKLNCFEVFFCGSLAAGCSVESNKLFYGVEELSFLEVCGVQKL